MFPYFFPVGSIWNMSVSTVCLKKVLCQNLRMQTCIQMLPPRNFWLTLEQEQSRCSSKESKIQARVKCESLRVPKTRASLHHRQALQVVQPWPGDLGPVQAGGRSQGADSPRDTAQRVFFPDCFAKSNSQEECKVLSYLLHWGYFQGAWRKTHWVCYFPLPTLCKTNTVPWQVEGTEKLLSFCLLIIFLCVFSACLLQ